MIIISDQIDTSAQRIFMILVRLNNKFIQTRINNKGIAFLYQMSCVVKVFSCSEVESFISWQKEIFQSSNNKRSPSDSLRICN